MIISIPDFYFILPRPRQQLVHRLLHSTKIVGYAEEEYLHGFEFLLVKIELTSIGRRRRRLARSMRMNWCGTKRWGPTVIAHLSTTDWPGWSMQLRFSMRTSNARAKHQQKIYITFSSGTLADVGRCREESQDTPWSI